MPFPNIDVFINGEASTLVAWKQQFSDFKNRPTKQKTQELKAKIAELKERIKVDKNNAKIYLLLSMCEDNLSGPVKSLPSLDMAIRYGNSEAMFKRAQLHESGILGTCDLNAATYLYKLAAKEGHKEAQIKLDNMQAFGLDDILGDTSDGQSGFILENLNRFVFEVNALKNYKTVYFSKDRIKLLNAVSDFYNEAQILCFETAKQSTQEEYNKIAGEKVLNLAKKSFSHRHGLLRILADIVFIPIGIVTLGGAFLVKEGFTGAKTFFGAETDRFKIYKKLIEDDLAELEKNKGFES